MQWGQTYKRFVSLYVYKGLLCAFKKKSLHGVHGLFYTHWGEDLMKNQCKKTKTKTSLYLFYSRTSHRTINKWKMCVWQGGFTHMRNCHSYWSGMDRNKSFCISEESRIKQVENAHVLLLAGVQISILQNWKLARIASWYSNKETNFFQKRKLIHVTFYV